MILSLVISSLAQSQELIELNGFKNKFKTSSFPAMAHIGFMGKNIEPFLTKSRLANFEFQKFKTNKKVGFISLITTTTVGFTIMLIDISEEQRDPSFFGPVLGVGAFLGLAAAGALISIPFDIAAKRHLKYAVKIYNEEMPRKKDNSNFGKNTSISSSLNLGINPSGVAGAHFSLRF